MIECRSYAATRADGTASRRLSVAVETVLIGHVAEADGRERCFARAQRADAAPRRR